MDIEIIAVSRYGCSRPLPGGRRIVLAVARRMEIKLALFVRSPSGPPCDSSLLSFAYITGKGGGSDGASEPQNCLKILNFRAPLAIIGYVCGHISRSKDKLKRMKVPTGTTGLIGIYFFIALSIVEGGIDSENIPAATTDSYVISQTFPISDDRLTKDTPLES